MRQKQWPAHVNVRISPAFGPTDIDRGEMTEVAETAAQIVRPVYRRSVRSVVALLASAAVMFVVVPAVPASATDTRLCVTRAEYRAVHRGMPKHQVIAIWDGRGEVAEGGRVYRACGGGHVGVNYSYTAHPHVISKYRIAS